MVEPLPAPLLSRLSNELDELRRVAASEPPEGSRRFWPSRDRCLIEFLAGTGARTRHRRILFEQGEQKGAFGGKLTVNRAFGETGGLGDVIQCPELKATFSEQSQTGLDQHGSGFVLATLADDSHGYLGYAEVPTMQALIGQNR